MPNEIKSLPDGKISARLETGEIFEGDPLEVTTKLAEAQVNTKRWGQGFKTELDTLKATPPPTPATPTPAEQNDAQLQAYLLDQQGKALGYKNGDEYKTDLARIKAIAEESANKNVAADFMNQCQDFPNTPEAIDLLSKKIDQMGWSFSPESMIAAHSVLIRENASDATKGYKPLSVEEQNATWEQGLRNSNRATPPPMIRSSAPDSGNRDLNPYDPKQIKLEDLRALAIKQQLEGR